VEQQNPSASAVLGPTAAARFDVSQLTTRNSDALNSEMSANVATPLLDSATGLFSAEAGYLNGSNLVGCTHSPNCTITLSAGAKVISYSHELITGNTATVTATIQVFQQMAFLDSQGNVASWITPSSEATVNEGLTQVTPGTWEITSRVGDFVPGTGP